MSMWGGGGGLAGGSLVAVNIGEISPKFTVRMVRNERSRKDKASKNVTGHRPLLDFLDLRFIERPSLKRSQFTSKGSREKYN